MTTTRLILAALLIGALAPGGCVAPSERLGFPKHPMAQTPTQRLYDTDGDGRCDFGVDRAPNDGSVILTYDDDRDGAPDRRYRLADYAPDTVPHLIILFDSIPFAQVEERWRESHWDWFDPPVKVIPPFPTMSPVIFARMIGSPPQPGAINQYYDRRSGERVDRVFERTTGSDNAWERRLHYRSKYWENGLAFIYPRRWFRTELSRAKKAFDASPDRVTVVYLATTACMLSKHGRQGLEECLEGLDQLTMQLLYERCGAVKISAVADHGHNLAPGRRIEVPEMLRAAGFTPADRLREDRDVVVEQDGLVNYVGIHTRHAAEVAAVLAARPELELAIYLAGERVIVRDAGGSASIEQRAGRYRYAAIDSDVLGYEPVIGSLAGAGKLDKDGFAGADDWFGATIDHRWPDAPLRLWEAFHGLVVNTPDVMVTTRTGYYVGLESFETFIDMASTHGGLDQADSATFLLTMTGRAKRPLRTRDVLRTVEPSYDPSVLRR